MMSWIVDQHQVPLPGFNRSIDQTLEGIVAVHIAVDHQKGPFTQYRQGLDDPSCRLQRRRLSGYPDAQAPVTAIATKGGDLVSKV